MKPPRSACCRVIAELTFDPDVGIALLTCPACHKLCAPQDHRLTFEQTLAAISTGNAITDVALRNALREIARPYSDAHVVIWCPLHGNIHDVVSVRDTLCVDSILKNWGLR